jgi:HtrA serine peptidase 2
VLGASREADIALLQIESEIPNEEFATVELGNSDALETGEFVVAVGSPLQLRNSVTFGIVSSECRSSFEFFSQAAATSFIQTDAPINQGNSGGPLLNLDGQVIGINSMKASMSDGISFAIPITPAKLIIDQILLTGSYAPPFIGVRLLTLTKSIIQMERQMDPEFPGIDSGILVVEVMENSPAEKAGLQTGDVIIACNGKPAKDVSVVMRETQAGKPFTLKIRRGDGTQLATVEPIPRPEPPKPKRRWRW